MKRLFDISVSLFGIFLFLPLMLLIAVLILLDDGHDYLFYQERIGKNKRPFTIPKFRTMLNGKVTRVGKWLRNTGLDELPQLISILNGDMSIVGPRPLTANDISRLKWENHTTRWSIKPGITGLAQLTAGQGASFSLKADTLYAKSYSIFLDLKVIAYSLLINLLGKTLIRQKIQQYDIFNLH